MNYLYGVVMLLTGIAVFFFEDNNDERLSYVNQRRRTFSLQVALVAYFCNIFMHFPWVETGGFKDKEITICVLNLLVMAGIVMMIGHKSGDSHRKSR